MMTRPTAAVLALLVAAGAAAGQRWHHPLYLGRGEFWRGRIAIEVRSRMDSPAAGEPVAVRIGRQAGQADLAGQRAEALRVCDANGTELLYALSGPDGEAVRKGPIPAGGSLTVPAECPARGRARCYVYFDNPSAWAVPDFLPAAVGVRNGGVERGTGGVPTGWRHDEQDDAHRVFWATERPHAGKRCLKTAVAAGAEATWIATRQGGIAVRGGAKYRMQAWVRAEGVRGNAGWYIHVGTAGESMMISPMLYGGEGTYDWKEVTATFTAPAGATTASLGTVLRGTGTAWFDDVTLTCLSPASLTAAAGKPERLDLARVGGDADWPAGGPDYRAPITLLNFSRRPAAGAMVAVDASALTARFRGRIDPRSLTVADGGRVLPHCRLGDLLVFEARVAPRTARTWHACFAAAGAAAPADAVAARADYARLLSSPRNLVRNARFDRGEVLPADWPGGTEGTRPGGATTGLDKPGLFGPRCVRIHVPHGSQRAWIGWRQSVPVRPGRTYVLAAWVKCRDIRSGSVLLHAHYRNAAGGLCRTSPHASAGRPLTGRHDWTLMSATFRMPADAASFQLHLTMNATGTLWHDGVVLVEALPATAGRAEARSAGPRKALAVWAVNPVVKVFGEDLPPRKPRPARIAAARNESEPLQLAVRSGEALDGVSVEVGPATAPGGAKLDAPTVGVVGYVPIDRKTSYYRSESPAWHRKIPTRPGACDGWAGLWPDPILPRRTLDLKAGRTQPIWITFAVPKTAPAGDYTGAVRLVRGGRTLARLAFTLHVWDFALPDAASLAAIYDVRMHGRYWHRPGRTRRDALREMWRFLAARRLCPDRIHPEPSIRYAGGKVVADFAAYDRAAAYYFDVLKLPRAYMPRLFYLFGWGHPPRACFGERPYEGQPPYEGADRARLRPAYKRAFQACLRAYWEHVRQKGWHKKLVLYISDEPHDRHEYVRRQMKALCEMIHEVDRRIGIYSSTWHHQAEWDDALDVWGIGHYGVVPTKKMADLRAAGKRLWFTTDGQMCTDTPYCAVERLLPHYCFHYGVEAYEFWGVDWLTYDPYEFGWHRYIHQSDRPGSSYYVRYPNGDGYLAYPPRPGGDGAIVPSIRLEQAREGVEDYEYLRLLRGLLAQAGAAGKDAAAGRRAIKLARGLVTIPNAGGRYSTKALPDPDAVYRVRRAVAEAIEAMSR